MSFNLLSPEQQQQLETLLSGSMRPSLRRRAETLLLYDQGLNAGVIARLVQITSKQARRWRRRFQKEGMSLFEDNPADSPLPEPQSGLAIGMTMSDSQPPEQPKEDLEPVAEIAHGKAGKLDAYAAEISQQKNPGVRAGDLMPEAGRKVLGYHFAQMLLHEDGTRLGTDIEELHDMRVATRRMRAAFEIFETAFKPKIVRSLLRGLRATGRALGHVRDLDVFLEKADHYLETLPEEKRASLTPLLEHWQQDLQTARQELVAFLDSSTYKDFKHRFLEFVTTPGAGARRLQDSPPEPRLVCEVAPVLIYQRLAEARAFDAIMLTASVEQFHMLRIEFKKLRYTLEYFREVLGSESREVIQEIKTLQDHLGDLNDAQVATEILRNFLAGWDNLQEDLPVSERALPDAVMAYLSYRYAERQELMQTFPAAWERFNRPELRQLLAQAISVL